MTYEYEKSNTNTVSLIWKHDAGVARLDELKEVYAKAKALDEILNVDYIVAPDDYAHEVTKIIDKYMEDK